jgi:hypothetical protein
MMYHFAYWLENFKELSVAKSQNLIKVLIQISARTESECGVICKLIDCSNLLSYRRVKQIIIKKYGNEFSQSEKKALTLFGDYLEFREYSNYKFPEPQNSNLIKYCETMSMSYSYKAVFLLVLARSLSNTQSVALNVLCDRIADFYRERIDCNLPGEKSNSVFAQTALDSNEIKKTIINNPMKVLIDAGVIVWDKKSNYISLSTSYPLGNESNRLQVIDVCKERIRSYYELNGLNHMVIASISDEEPTVTTELNKLKDAINMVVSEAEREMLLNAYNSLRIVLGVEENTELRPLDTNDERKIGALVQECIDELEKSGYDFSDEQLKNLLSLEWSSKSFKKLYYPVLKLFDPSKTVDEQKVDYKGNGRYYDRVYTLSGKQYLLTSQWYKDAKIQFINWYNDLIGGSSSGKSNGGIKTIKVIPELSEYQKMQLDFWQSFVNHAFNKEEFKNTFRKRKPQPQHWYDLSIGKSTHHVALTVNSRRSCLGVSIYISNDKDTFDRLLANRSNIEEELGANMEWIKANKDCRVLVSTHGDIKARPDLWDVYFDWFCEMAIKLRRIALKYGS